jgi:argininosuccinate lyase
MEYGNSGERARLQPYILDLASGSTKVMAGFATTIRPMKQKMLLLATEGFSTTTELADTLVRGSDISFRQAHEIVAQTVLRAIAEGKTADQITAEMVQESAVESTGKKLNITGEELLLALNPTENVKRRNVIGGPAPTEVQRMIEDRWEKIRSQEAGLEERRGHLESSHETLEKAEAEITQSVTQE